MTFTIETLPVSIAATLAPWLSGNVTFLNDPSQQSADDMPCMFLQTRYGYVERRIQAGGGYWERKIGLDLTYLEDYNLPDLAKRYERTAELLDEHLDIIRYTDVPPRWNYELGTWMLSDLPFLSSDYPAKMMTYDRSYTVDQDALHYQFEIRVRVAKPEDGAPMQTLTQNTNVSEAEDA